MTLRAKTESNELKVLKRNDKNTQSIHNFKTIKTAILLQAPTPKCDADEGTSEPETMINFKLQLSIFNHYRNTTVVYNILMALLKRLVIVLFREKNCSKHLQSLVRNASDRWRHTHNTFQFLLIAFYTLLLLYFPCTSDQTIFGRSFNLQL